jgi:hypothetical protein
MSLTGMDLNATRARAVYGPRQHSASPLRLEGEHLELPLALSLQGRRPAVGRAGTALARTTPHLACTDFLPFLGADRTWSAGKLSLNAERAVGFVFEDLGRALGSGQGVAVAVPAYLSESQVFILRQLAEKARWRMVGSVPAPVAAALSVYGTAAGSGEGSLWSGLALVLDVDGHALTWSAVEVAGQARLLQVHPAPHLARGAWLRRMLDGIALRCVRLSRRDPRQSGLAEQSLYEQLTAVLDSGVDAGALQLSIQGEGWFQHLMLHADELAGYVALLVRQTLAELDNFLTRTGSHEHVGAVLMTPAAGRLPGLARVLDQRLHQLAADAGAEGGESDSDFGEGLLAQERGSWVHVLGADAIARAAHDVAVRIYRGDLPPGHLDAVPLAAGAADPSADTGPARLNFRGRDHILSGPTFTLGRDPACDLVFESELYPTVSGRHCDIVFDRRAYTLWDRSRHGTLLNDRRVARQAALHSGDWIRLGPSGPVLRFLGRAAQEGRGWAR